MNSKWKKNLYDNHSYPDNYTDETFLKELKVNVYFKPVTFWNCVSSATLIVNELCTIIIFVVMYLYLHYGWVNPNYILHSTSTITFIAFIVYRICFSNGLKWTITLGHDLRTVLIFVVFGQLFSPILYTLTDTISTDTIYTMTFLMMLIHLVFFEYGVSTTIVSNSLPLSAAVFASICLSSRLASPYEAFILMTISMECFILFPLLRNKIGKSLILTLLLIGFVLYALIMLSLLMATIFVFLVLFLNIFCPLLFTKYQIYKDNIYGPWDEAVVHGLDRSND